MTQHEQLRAEIKRKKLEPKPRKRKKRQQRRLKIGEPQFVAEVMKPGVSPVEAAMKAGLTYVPRGKFIEEAKDAMVERCMTAASITAERILVELGRIAFFDPAMCYDEDGRLLRITEMPADARAALAGFEVEKRTEGRGEDAEDVYTFKIKHVNKNQALEVLAKYHPEFQQRLAEASRNQGDGRLAPPVINVNFGTINNG
jgi:hypothetical protein